MIFKCVCVSFYSQDSVCELAQCVPEVEAGCGGRLGSGVCRHVGVWPPLRHLWRWLHLLRLQGAAVSWAQCGSSELRHRLRRPAVPVRRVFEQSSQNHQVPEQRQSAAVHRWEQEEEPRVHLSCVIYILSSHRDEHLFLLKIHLWRSPFSNVTAVWRTSG